MLPSPTRKDYPLLDELSRSSSFGAVNVIKNENRRLQGYNTDGRGFVEALREEGIDPGERALLLDQGSPLGGALAGLGVSRRILVWFSRARPGRVHNQPQLKFSFSFPNEHA